MPCTYKIRNKRTDECYCGSALDFSIRYRKIRCRETGVYDWANHHNWRVAMYAKRGDDFEYSVIQEYDTLDEAKRAEQSLRQESS